MIPKIRRDIIIEALNARGYISIEELAQLLYVSLATVRRDLNELENEVLLKRTYGGASFILQDCMIVSGDYRTNFNSDEKIKIGKKATELVVVWFAKQLANKINLHVLTNNVSIAQILAKESTNEITCDTYNYKHGSIYGSDAASYVHQRHSEL